MVSFKRRERRPRRHEEHEEEDVRDRGGRLHEAGIFVSFVSSW
jgi:hypothetical protein